MHEFPSSKDPWKSFSPISFRKGRNYIKVASIKRFTHKWIGTEEIKLSHLFPGVLSPATFLLEDVGEQRETAWWKHNHFELCSLVLEYFGPINLSVRIESYNFCKHWMLQAGERLRLSHPHPSSNSFRHSLVAVGVSQSDGAVSTPS